MTNMNIYMTPSLSVIESNLFDPPLTVAADHADIGVRLKGDTAAPSSARRETQPAPPLFAEIAEVRVPAHLVAKIRQRVACQAQGWPLRPEPGLIVRVDEVPADPPGFGQRALSQPLVVLLSAPKGKDLWDGWLMGWETDYASHRDLLLEEEDEPYDPLAAMVQTWNPVTLYWPSASAVLGRLRPERLAAVRELAEEDDAGGASFDKARPGGLLLRTTKSGHLVLTGTPLGDRSDPRWRYRDLYLKAAAVLQAAAQRAPAAQPARPWWQDLLDAFQEGVRAAGLGLAPVPMPALGADESESGSTWKIEDWLEWRLIPDSSGDSVRIRFRLIQETPLQVGLLRGEQVRQQQRLSPDQPEAELIAGRGQGLAVFIRDDAGTMRLTLPLDR